MHLLKQKTKKNRESPKYWLIVEKQWEIYCQSDSKAMICDLNQAWKLKSPFECSLCGSKFAQKELVKVPEKKNHINAKLVVLILNQTKT